jgi:hypothetical protein
MNNLIVKIAGAALINLFVMHSALPAEKCEPAALSTKYPSLAGKTIRIAQDPQGPPYAFRDPENFEHLVGLDADIVRTVFACISAIYGFSADIASCAVTHSISMRSPRRWARNAPLWSSPTQLTT